MRLLVKILVIGIVFIIVFFTLSIKSFQKIINYNDIGIIKVRESGSGILYTTKDKDLIDMFISIMDQSNYLRIINMRSEVVGGNTICLYSPDDKEIIRISFRGNNRMKANGKYYVMLKNINNELIEFDKLFYKDENIK